MDITEIFLQFYEQRPRTSHLNDPNVQARALIDVYDFVAIIRQQQAEITALKERLIQSETALAQYRLRADAGSLDLG